MRRLCFLTALFLGLTFLTSCEDKQETDLFKAQDCIDKASPANVNACLNQIQGDNSERAYVLRCSAAFISEGIDEDAIVAAIENIDGGGSGDPTTPAISALAMSTTTISTAAVSTCSATNSDALSALANFANIATAMKALLGFADGATAADIDALIDAYVATPPANDADKAALGAAVIASQASLCNADTGLFKDNDACTDINAAISAGGADPNAVADALMGNIDNQSN